MRAASCAKCSDLIAGGSESRCGRSPLKIAVNATSLLSPFTGIGQYTRNLMLELLQRPELELEFFYGLGWSRELRAAPLAGYAEARSVVKRFIPGHHALWRAQPETGRPVPGLRRSARRIHVEGEHHAIGHQPRLHRGGQRGQPGLPGRARMAAVAALVHRLPAVRTAAGPAGRLAALDAASGRRRDGCHVPACRRVA